MEIIRKDKIFVIEGEINASNVSQFKKKIKTLLKFNSELIINVEKVSSISMAGIKAFIELNLFAFEKKKVFSVEGKQINEFYNQNTSS
ncbi:STAS domain-containing protein [Neotamlana sedimentorum]|nr:STAS domain-containing protein [Tamlana sedimentorum]